MESKYYIGSNKDKKIIKTSSSGGAFASIVHAWFEMYQDAFVCGCIMNDELNAIHIFADNEEASIPMRGSKYIPSDLNGALHYTLSYLKKGKAVLFSGTPCQVSALNKFLYSKCIDTSNLLTVEVICHGVANKNFFKDYISHLEKKYKSDAISINFRAKCRPGNIQDMQVKFSNGKVYNASSTKYDWFYSLYNNNIILQSGCYSCPFAKKERYADISLGDAWGKSVNFGKSLILVNTPKGDMILHRIKIDMDLKEIEPDEVDQPTLYHPAIKPDNYDEFWRLYNEKGYLAAQKYVGNNTLKTKTIDKIVYIADLLGIKQYLKRITKKKD